MISPRNKSLSIRKQCEVLSVSRSSLYYAPKEEKPENQKMMRMMDEHLLAHPTEGVISMVHWLRERGYVVGPKRIRRLFRLMGHETIYRRKNLTKGARRAYIRPYLLRGLEINRANQVWCTDITYIPMAKGFMYLTALIDVYSRKLVGWSLSNSMSTKWCLEMLQEAIRQHGKPEIINSDQGSQYTSPQWTQYLEDQEIGISMDGKGRATDNRWIERFWKTLKYGHVYLNPADTGLDLYKGIGDYIEYYHRRRHQTLGTCPEEAYQESRLKSAA